MPHSHLNRALIAVSCAGLLGLAACGDSGSGDMPDSPGDGPAIAPETDAPANDVDTQAVLAALGEAYVNADLANGERMWRRCQSCHTVTEGGRHMVGPNLYGMFGQQAGTMEGFRYSSALAEAGFVWTPAELDEWLANPRTFLPGNRMSFAGLRNESDRIDLIGWLAVATAPADFAESFDPEADETGSEG
ncbi:c-type cytochrome [Alkalicaulis satelles]|uniref:c-type cytochrome n=1 Tax=Alkalicaulis satelles TaxID=2609175 RepID=UPI0018EB9242|nr:cytochrome c family protein [Alkalicaulis satelles]